jgi:hypothetical protein
MMNNFVFLVVAGLCLAQTLNGQSPAACIVPMFAQQMAVLTGLFASGVGIGDFNSDGLPDLAVTNQNANNVSIVFGNGAGAFGGKTELALSGPPQRISVADLNRDGKLDLVLPIQAKNTVSIFWGQGMGTFSEAENIPVEGGPFMPQVADLNADGKPDLAVTTTGMGSRRVAVLLGKNDGGFAAAQYYGGPSFGNSPNALGVEDFNRDGKLDLAIGGGPNSPPDTNNMSVFLGDGKGSFSPPSYFTVGPSPQSMSLADFNVDGIVDIAISNSLPAGVNSTVSVLLGDGKGSFAARTPYPIGEVGRGTGIADFNLDGKHDLVVANNNSKTVSVLLGDGHGGFGPKTDFPVGTNPRKLTVGDFNRDGKPDVAVPNTGSNDVSILLNSCVP